MSSMIDLVGQRFGKLVVVALSNEIGHGRKFWQCKCDCGGDAYVRGGNLRSGNTRSCGKCKYRARAIAAVDENHRTAAMAALQIPLSKLWIHWFLDPRADMRKVPQTGFVVWEDVKGREILCSYITQDSTDSRPVSVLPRVGRRVMEQFMARHGLIPERARNSDRVWLARCGIMVPPESHQPKPREAVMALWNERRQMGYPTPGGTAYSTTGKEEFEALIRTVPTWAQRLKLKPEPPATLLDARAALEGTPAVDTRSSQPDVQAPPPRPVLNLQPATLDDLLAAPEFDTRPAPPNPTPAPKATRAPHEIDIPAALDEIRQRMRGTWKDPEPAPPAAAHPATEPEDEEDDGAWGE